MKNIVVCFMESCCLQLTHNPAHLVPKHLKIIKQFKAVVIVQSDARVEHLDKVQQAAEAPGNRVEPLGTRIGPLRVHQLGQVTVGEVAVAEACWVILHGDVAGGEVAEAQEVAGALDVALLLRREDGKSRGSQALLAALPAWRKKTSA